MSTNTYLFKALDAYPYDLEETMEALHYALSYDDKNVDALCLMGQVYAETLQDYTTAIAYYQEAFVEKPSHVKLYKHYIDALIWNADYDEALRVADYAITIKAIDKASILKQKALILERLGKYKSAGKQLKKARMYAYNTECLSELKSEAKRIKNKLPKKKKRRSKKKKK